MSQPSPSGPSLRAPIRPANVAVPPDASSFRRTLASGNPARPRFSSPSTSIGASRTPPTCQLVTLDGLAMSTSAVKKSRESGMTGRKFRLTTNRERSRSWIVARYDGGFGGVSGVGAGQVNASGSSSVSHRIGANSGALSLMCSRTWSGTPSG